MANYNPFHDPHETIHHGGRPRVTFGATEMFHLAAAVAVLTIAFTVFETGLAGLLHFGRVAAITLFASFLAVGSGFVLHELAHKVLAQRYGHWAEFRAHFPGLGMTLLLALFTPVLFAAPGAVLIQGRVTPRENGLISLAGPATNLVLAFLAWPFAWAVNADALLPAVASRVALINAFLCLFNLVPLGPLDGRKVLAWSKLGYTASALAALLGFLAILIWTNGF